MLFYAFLCFCTFFYVFCCALRIVLGASPRVLLAKKGGNHVLVWDLRESRHRNRRYLQVAPPVDGNKAKKSEKSRDFREFPRKWRFFSIFGPGSDGGSKEIKGNQRNLININKIKGFLEGLGSKILQNA